MIRFITLLGLSVCAVVMTSCRSPAPQQEAERFRRLLIQHADRERYADMFVPAHTVTREPMPLVIVLHGSGQTPEDIASLTGFNNLATLERFAVVYPAGTGNTPERLYWNVLQSGTYATEERVDDFGFLNAVVTQVMQEVAIDRSRIYAVGFSQGGMLCYRLACDPLWSTRLAAMAVVGATMTVAPDDCAPGRLVPLLSIHGMQDPFSNFAGGIAAKAMRNDRVPRPGLYETIDYWVEQGGFTGEPDTSDSRGQAACRRFASRTNDYEIISWEINNGGHAWPGSPANLPEWMVGNVNHDIQATALIWNFFARHPAPAE